MTSATGYLGSHVLDELLVETNAHIYCLIRPSEHVTLNAKLKDSLQFYFGKVGIAMMDERVTVIQGDLGKPVLDLSSEDEQTLIMTDNTTINNAS